MLYLSEEWENVVVACLFTQSTAPEGKDFSIFSSCSLAESLICEAARAASENKCGSEKDLLCHEKNAHKTCVFVADCAIYAICP